MKRAFYTVAIMTAQGLGTASHWLWEIVLHWLRHPLGFAVVPLALVVWGPVRLLFEGMFYILFRVIIPRYPLEERLQTWPNR